MQVIKYQLLQSTRWDGTPILAPVTVDYSETNLAFVKKEAYNGEYTIEDDGRPEPVSEPTTDDVLNAMLGVM